MPVIVQRKSPPVRNLMENGLFLFRSEHEYAKIKCVKNITKKNHALLVSNCLSSRSRVWPFLLILQIALEKSIHTYKIKMIETITLDLIKSYADIYRPEMRFA